MNPNLLARINILSDTFDHAAAVRIAELEEQRDIAQQSCHKFQVEADTLRLELAELHTRKNTGVKQPFVRRPLCRVCHRRRVDYALTGKCENCSQNDG